MECSYHDPDRQKGSDYKLRPSISRWPYIDDLISECATKCARHDSKMQKLQIRTSKSTYQGVTYGTTIERSKRICLSHHEVKQ